MPKKVRVIRCENGTVYSTVAEAARAMGGSARPILHALNGRQPTAYGMKWNYERKGGQ